MTPASVEMVQALPLLPFLIALMTPHDAKGRAGAVA